MTLRSLNVAGLVRAAIFAAAGLFVMGMAAPADAKSYAGRELGTWDGYKNGIYVGRPKSVTQSGTKFRKSASNRNVASKGKRYAALDRGSINDAGPARRSIASSQGGVRWVASSGCLNSTLRSVISAVSSYGSVTVSSTCRSRGHNAAVGGAKHSQHLSGNAVDFRVHGNIRGALAYLQGAGRVGGFKHYGGGLFHVDTGARRTW